MAKSKRVGLREIASRVNCNVSTVSRALNGHPGVSVENARNILKIAYELGYCNSQEKRIAVLLPKSTIPLFWYSMSLLNAIREEVVKRQLLLEFVFADQVEKMLERSISGILSFEFLDNSLGKLSEIVPMVCINDSARHIDRVYSVFSNEFQAVNLAVSHLVGYGHRRIGMIINGDPESYCNRTRHEAFDRMMRVHNLSIFAECVHGKHTPGDPDSLVRLLHGAVLRMAECGVTAIINTGESEAASVLHSLGVCRFRVPEDFSLITWEMVDVSEFLSPPQTTLCQNFAELARRAFETLEKLVAGEPVCRDTLVDYLLCNRSSVAIPSRGR